jgi:hypothetical protein
MTPSLGLKHPQPDVCARPSAVRKEEMLDRTASTGELWVMPQATWGVSVMEHNVRDVGLEMRLMIFIATGFFLMACETLNETSVRDMPTGYLCTFLDPNTWITTSNERQAVFGELKRRNADCILPSGTSKPKGT